MSVKLVKGVWRYQVTAHFNEGTSIRVSGRSPWDDNTEAGAKRAEAEHILYFASLPPSAKPTFRPTNRKAAMLRVHAEDPAARLVEMTTPPKPAVPTLREFVPTYLAHARSSNTKSTYLAKEGRVRDFLLKVAIHGRPLADLRLDEFTNAVMEDFKLALVDMRCGRYKAGVRKLSPGTVNLIINTLSNCLRYAKFRAIIDKTPEVHRLRQPKAKVSNFITEREVDQLLSCASGMWLALYATAYYSGMRRGEILGVRKSDVDLSARKLTVNQAWVSGEFKAPKDGESREVWLCRDAVEILSWWLPQIPEGQDLLFAINGRPITAGTVQSQLTRLCRLAGIRLISLRTLRHSFATHLAKKGNLEEVQGFLGHSEIAMTMNYVHRTPDAARRTVEHLSRGQSKRWVLGPTPARLKARTKTERELRAERAARGGGDALQESLHVSLSDSVIS